MKALIDIVVTNVALAPLLLPNRYITTEEEVTSATLLLTQLRYVVKLYCATTDRETKLYLMQKIGRGGSQLSKAALKLSYTYCIDWKEGRVELIPMHTDKRLWKEIDSIK